MRNVWLVARRELQVGLTRTSYIVTTAIIAVLLVAGVLVLNHFFGQDTSGLSFGEEGTDPLGATGARYLIVMVMSAILLFALIFTGSMLSSGVIEEKSSRVVELLLSSMRASDLLAGKVLGIGIIGLIQMLIYTLAVFIPAKAMGLFAGLGFSVGGVALEMLAWFLLGFAALGTLWAALSSLVSRQEDAGGIVAPLVLLAMVPFYLEIYLVPTSPDGGWATALSMAPFTAPFVMPMRQVFVSVPAWQLVTAVALNLAVIPLVIFVAGRIYRRAVLQTGSRMKLRDALRTHD